MTAMGHEDPFAPPGLSGRYVIRQETLAGTRGNGRFFMRRAGNQATVASSVSPRPCIS